MRVNGDEAVCRALRDFDGIDLSPDRLRVGASEFEAARTQVGDTVVYGFRPQIFTTRAQIAVVDQVDSAPRVLGLFDRGNNLIDENGHPLEDATSRARELMGALTAR